MTMAGGENLDPIYQLESFGFVVPGDESVSESECRLRNWISSEGVGDHEIPFIYKGNSITSPGSIFTVNEVAQVLGQENSTGREGIAFAIHGNIHALNIDLARDLSFYEPSQQEKKIIEELIGIKDFQSVFGDTFDIGPNEFIGKLVEQGLSLHDATDKQAHQGCAVLNTAQKIYLATRFYKEVLPRIIGIEDSQTVNVYFEDSSLNNGNADDVYQFEIDSDSGQMRFANGGEIQKSINEAFVFGCVDETAGTQDFGRGENAHNAKYISIGTKGTSIDAFLISDHLQLKEPGFASLHFLHHQDRDHVDDARFSPVTKSTKANFDHLVRVIAANNEQNAEIVIDKRLLKVYLPLIQELRDRNNENDESHKLQSIRLVIVDEEKGSYDTKILSLAA